MVITETGASSAVAKLLPELDGKLTGNAIRVPTPNVSLAILNLTLERETTQPEVNEYLRHMSLHSSLQRQIEYTDSAEVVSSDFVGRRYACTIDGGATIVDKNRGGPLRVVRQRVRLRVPGDPRGPEMGRHQLSPHSGRRRQDGLRLTATRRGAAGTP